MNKANTGYVDIAVGQWVVAFGGEYFHPDNSLIKSIEALQYKGAGWDWCTDKVLVVHCISKVMPKTYLGYRNDDGAEFRESRNAIVATFSTEKEAEICRRQLLAIGALADERIAAETARLIDPFEKAERAYALQQVRGLLPHIFGA
ncbi:hypothetical protein RI570_11195 [Brucella pseudogrignonensis]|uniref:hypothetical protein n=1 Tax=Brucella pseudogrignonensis TaxID=419475 RepID=UPI0028B773FF|nr:hypothetical protein [Brucella pseudogrignonensis]MDT6940712.1 hypothetical protein [Brucella pseudogrignonensis]